MKVTVLDDYQHAISPTQAIARLRQNVEVQIIHEQLASEAAVVDALKDSQAVIPIRERTQFTASLLKKLPRLEFIAQTGNHAYHIDMEAATAHGVVVCLAPGGNSTTELTFGLMLDAMRRISRSDQAMRRGQWPLMLGYVLERQNPGNFGPRQDRHGSRGHRPSFRHESDRLGTDLDPRTRREIVSHTYAP